MKFYFHEYAEAEFAKAVAYYEDCRRGLGIEFAQEVYVTIDRIVQFPDAWLRCPGIPAAALSIGSLLALFTRLNLALCV
jgi:hypothetical protein